MNDTLFSNSTYDKRIFSKSRSTFAGSGKYTGHFLRDCEKSIFSLNLSISNIMNFNMIRIPFVGLSASGIVND